MKVIAITTATAGDCLPLITVCAELRTRGHDVHLIAPYLFEQSAHEAGLVFLPLCSLKAHELAMREKSLLTTRFEGLFHLRHSLPWNITIHQYIGQHCVSDLSVLAIDRTTLWADMSICRSLNLPLVRLTIDLPWLPNAPFTARHLPPTGVQRRLAARWESQWRLYLKSSGYEAGPGHLARLWNGRRFFPTLALWPPWIASAHLAKGSPIGFVEPWILPNQNHSTASALHPCIVCVAGTMGTTSGWSTHFFRVSEAVCLSRGIVGVFLGGEPYLPESDLVTWSPFRPLDDILQNAKALIHHGGIGTAAAAIKSGVPQLVVPRVFGQFGNAEWLRRLGIAIVIDHKEYCEATVLYCLTALLANTSYSERSLFNLCSFYAKPTNQSVRRNRIFLELGQAEQ